MLAVLLDFLRALINSYGISILLFQALRLLVGERWGLIAFFNTFAEWLLLPSIFLTVIALLTQSWLSVALCVPPLLMFIVGYGQQYIPRSISTPRAAPTVSVLTYNVLADPHPLDQAIAMLRASGADIIGLQEVSKQYDSVLKAALSDLYPYVASHPQPLRFDGQAVYSKFPILEDTYWQYEWLPTPLGHQRVVLQLPTTTFVLYNVHPTHPGMNGKNFDPSYRAREIADLLQRIGRETLPVIMMGDFNMPDHSDDYRALRKQLEDSYRDVGWGMGWTFRAMLPLAFLRLDYVFHDKHWETLRAEVVQPHGGSDHFAVLARVALVMD